MHRNSKTHTPHSTSLPIVMMTVSAPALPSSPLSKTHLSPSLSPTASCPCCCCVCCSCWWSRHHWSLTGSVQHAHTNNNVSTCVVQQYMTGGSSRWCIARCALLLAPLCTRSHHMQAYVSVLRPHYTHMCSKHNTSITLYKPPSHLLLSPVCLLCCTPSPLHTLPPAAAAAC